MKKEIKVSFNNDITEEQKINVLDMSYLNKDEEIEEMKRKCRQKKQYKTSFNFIIYLLAILGVLHTLIFYYNLIF